MNDTSRLKKRITAALANDNIGSNELFEIIAATEEAANGANAAAAQARAESTELDADPKVSATEIAYAEIERGQLQRAAAQLRDMLPATLNREAVAKYSVARDRLQMEGDAIEQELSDVYRAAAEKLIEVFKRATAFRDRSAKELPPIPPNTAALRKFDTTTTRLLEKVTLLNFAGEQIWPPPSVPFSVAAVAAMSFPELAYGHGNPIGPGWELPEAQARFRDSKDKQRAEDADRYARMTKESEERANREERERFAAGQRR